MTNQIGRGSAAKDTKRPARVAMSGSRKRMHIPEELKDPAFHYSWINDQGDLVQRAVRAWYEHVKISEMPTFGSADVDAASGPDSNISMLVDRKGTIAYMMKQPIEAHEEDLEIGRRMNSDRVADLRRQSDGKQQGSYGEVKFT